MDHPTRAEHAANIAAAEANLPVPMRRPDGEVRLVAPTNVHARIADGWAYVTADRRAA